MCLYDDRLQTNPVQSDPVIILTSIFPDFLLTYITTSDNERSPLYTTHDCFSLRSNIFCLYHKKLE